MKRIDKRTERRLYWLFVPMALVTVWLITFLWFDVNLLQACLGMDVEMCSAGISRPF